MKHFKIILFCLLHFSSIGQGEPSLQKCPLMGGVENWKDTIKLGETIGYMIHYPLVNGCAAFSDIEIQTTENEVNHWLYQICIPPGMTCTEEFRTGFTYQKFTPKKRGKMKFNFYKGEKIMHFRELIVK